MASLADHVLGMHLKRTISEVKERKNSRTRTPKNGIADILPAEGGDKQWFNAWSYIIHQVNQGKCAVCEDWKTASKFKRWFDANRCPEGVVTPLFNPVLNPVHFSPETTCIAPRAVTSLVARTGQRGRVGLRGVNYRQRANGWAYQALIWDLIKRRPVPTLTDTELGAHLMWGKSHVARIRAAIKDDVVNKNTKALIEKFCVAVEEYIAAGKHIDIFGVNK